MQRSLIIRHEGSDVFRLFRHDAGELKAHPHAVRLESPGAWKVQGWEAYSLSDGLRWYLEEYRRGFTASPFKERADQVLTSLEAWGRDTFERLFGDKVSGRYLDQVKDQRDTWVLRIQSDDPAVLAWPWEALWDPESGWVSLHASVERTLLQQPDPAALPDGLPQDRVRVLLLSPRPLDGDIAYRAVSGPLVAAVEGAELAVEIELLRPPTFEALDRALRENPGRWHVVHFDGHGDQKDGAGLLLFEDEHGREDEVKADKLGDLLHRHRIPLVVLNACRSGTFAAGGQDPFATVATALLRANVRSVVGMAYTLHRDGARAFVRAFYQELTTSGDTGRATWRGRQEMRFDDRRTVRGAPIPFQDWMLPVLYQSRPNQLPPGGGWRRARRLSVEAVPRRPVFDRDDRVLALERARRKRPGLVLVTGEEGVGKTAVVQDLCGWLLSTGWTGRVEWLDLAALGRPGVALDRMGMALGQDFFLLPPDEKARRLVALYREQPTLVVWDGLEALAGAEARELDRLLSVAEGLADARLQSRVVATCRQPPAWVPASARTRVEVERLGGSLSRAFAEQLIHEHGVELADAELEPLLGLFDGLPLYHVELLPLLQDVPAWRMKAVLKAEMAAGGGPRAEVARVRKALGV